MKRIAAFALLLLVVACSSAGPLNFPLGTNPDGYKDTAYPCLDGVTNCRPPPTGTLSCDVSTAPSLIGLTGAYSANWRMFFSGTNAATTTISIVTDSGDDAIANGWAISSSGAGNNLTNAGGIVKSGAFHLRGTNGAFFVNCGSVNWSYVATQTSDTTPPNPVTGINVPSVGTNTVTVAWDQTTDPDQNVQRKGVGTYRIKLNGATVDTLAAPSPGLANNFQCAAIGSVTGSPSDTQGTGASGGQHTLVGGGYGLENGQPTNVYSCQVAFAGDGCVIGRIDSITNTMTYNKGGYYLANSNSTTSAGIWPLVLRQGSVYALQYSIRPQDGGVLTTPISTVITGLPVYTKACSTGNVTAAISYSYDGGTWTPFASVSLALNNSKVAGFFAAATTSGADQGNDTVVFNNVRVQDAAAQLSKTVSTMTGGTWSVTAIDLESTPNESSAVGGASGTPNSGGGGGGGNGPVKKFHPGHYVSWAASSGHNCGTDCDAARHAHYVGHLDQANVVGVMDWVLWKYLENDAGGDFSAGFAWMHTEINYIKQNYPGKQFGIIFNFGPYGLPVQYANLEFPQYLVDAGCVYDENSAAASGGATSVDFFRTKASCMPYFDRLMAAYGAEFDSEPALEFIRLQQETDDAVNNIPGNPGGAAEDAAWEHMAASSAAAFPHTLIWIPMNWTGVETAASKEALLQYYKSIQVGVGDGDTIPAPKMLIGSPAIPGTQHMAGYDCPSTAMGCVIQGLNQTLGATNHNYCGEFVSMRTVELSELGYGTILGTPGLTSLQAFQQWENQTCAQYGIWEQNDNEAQNNGDNGATQYWLGANGQLATINANPITYTSKPAGFN